MRIFYRRPLALICAVFISASLLGFFIDGRMKFAATVLIMMLSLAAAAFAACRRLDAKKFVFCVAAAVSALAALLVSFIYFDIGYMSAQEYIGERHLIEGVVLEEKYSNSYSSGYGARLSSIDGKKVCYKVILDCTFVSDLQPGFKFSAKAEPEELGYSEYDASDKMYAIADGYVLRCVVQSDEDCDIIKEDVFVPSVWLNGLNRRASTLLTSAVKGEEGRLAAALLLGRKDLLADATVRDFRRSGASHILALSGMHLAILMGAAGFFLSKLGIGKGVRCALLIGFTGFYLALTGFSVSAARAAVMLSLVYLSYLFSAQSDTLTSLFAACAIILAVSPAAVCDAGFWMSFSATLGIVVGAAASGGLIKRIRHINNRGKKNQRAFLYDALKRGISCIAGMIITTVSASCAVAFCSWLYFGELSTLTIPANICIMPLATLLLGAALLFVMLSLIPISAAAGLISRIISALAGAMLEITSHLSQTVNAVVSMRYAYAGVIISVMSGIYIVMCVIRLKKKYFLAFPAVAAAVAFLICFGICSKANAQSLKVTYLNDSENGNGNEMLLLTNLGDAVICDISDGSRSCLRMALAAADAENVTEIKAYVLTHYHIKHIAATDKLLGTEIVRQLWLPEPSDEREYGVMLSLLNCAERRGCSAVIYKRGEELTLFGMANLSICTAYIKRSTHPVVTISLACSGVRFTYAGASVRESVLYDTAADYIKESNNIVFGAHGPVTKSAYSYEAICGGIEKIVFADDKILSAFRYDSEEELLFRKASLIRAPQICSFKYTLRQ
jgi:ComEC/Rec2-related protein